MPHCSQVATVVIVANSLSAAELLMHYGTNAGAEAPLPAQAGRRHLRALLRSHRNHRRQ